MWLFRWMGASASAPGRGHIEKGLPCQDASDVSLDGEVATIVVSDGAGSARHSEHGATVAVEVTTRVLRETAPWSDPREVRKRVLNACRVAMTKRAKALGCSVTELAATLAFVAVARDVFIAGNLGDGIVAAFRGDRSEVLIEPVRGEFANETVFLTSRQASKHLRIARKVLADYDGFAVMSDGAAESLYQRREGSLAPALSKILSWFEDRVSKDVCDAIQESALPLFVSRTLDDCSLAVLRYVRVELDALGKKPATFQMELLGSGNRRGLRNRLAVLDSYYRQGLKFRAVSEATGLSVQTVKRHIRDLKALLQS